MNIIEKVKEIRASNKHIWSWIPGGMGNVVDVNNNTIVVEYPGRRGQQSFQVDDKRMKIRQADGRFFIDLRQEALLNDLRTNTR